MEDLLKKVTKTPEATATKVESDHDKKEKDDMDILRNQLFPAYQKQEKKVDTKKTANDAVEQLKALTNPNVATPVAASNEAPKALATAVLISTNQLTKDLESSKI